MNATDTVTTVHSMAHVDSSMTGEEFLIAIQLHFQQNFKIYIGVLIVLIPFAIIFRRWSIPLTMYLVELSVYLTVMHVVLRSLLHLTAWFKDQSSMNKAFDTKSENPGWTTPLFEVWNRDAYYPAWVFYVEIGFLILVVVLMYRMRPLRPQKRRRKIEEEKQKMGASQIHKYKQGGL